MGDLHENSNVIASDSKRKRLSGKKNRTAEVPRQVSVSRRHAQATRTLKACDFCRKQKTRCFKASEEDTSCLRCTFLKKECSFAHEKVLQDSAPSLLQGKDLHQLDVKYKLDQIYNGVREILAHVSSPDSYKLLNQAKEIAEAADDARRSIATSGLPFGGQDPEPKHHLGGQNIGAAGVQDVFSLGNVGILPLYDLHMHSFKMAPFSIVSNQSAPQAIPNPIAKLINLKGDHPASKDLPIKAYGDIIDLNILSELEATYLINDFRTNYGRWVLFPVNIPSEQLIGRIRIKSPLLLTTCCCISLRYLIDQDIFPDNPKSNKEIYRDLIQLLLAELGRGILQVSAFQDGNYRYGDVEFLQALVILSIYSLSLSALASYNLTDESKGTIGQGNSLAHLNLDAWYLSSIGLTTFLSRSTFGTLMQKLTDDEFNDNSAYSILFDDIDGDTHQLLTLLRIYNHLVLVHLINSIFSGRSCVIDALKLRYCTATLGLPSSTNFDGRMVSEINILTVTYNFIQKSVHNAMGMDIIEREIGYKEVQLEIENWYNQWSYLFEQPSLQFVEPCYYFCVLVVVYAYNFQKSLLNTNQATFQLFDLYENDNIYFILDNSDGKSLRKMLESSYDLVKFVKTVESNSYFAYLSDQLHFCFYFGALFLLKILHYLKDTKQLEVVNSFDGNTNLEVVLADIHELIGKFEKIGGYSSNIIVKYYEGLQKIIDETFPGWDKD